MFKESKETYGYRRIKEKLDDIGLQINHKRVLRLTNKIGIKCTKFSRKTRRYNS
ncbi:MAG: IS3 family transposase [Tissierella sp.]|uniref:IS3 family transposase n=1 Tax=Tissierella sp. TaxID=41274 RepID=UPI003F9DF1A8